MGYLYGLVTSPTPIDPLRRGALVAMGLVIVADAGMLATDLLSYAGPETPPPGLVAVSALRIGILALLLLRAVMVKDTSQLTNTAIVGMGLNAALAALVVASLRGEAQTGPIAVITTCTGTAVLLPWTPRDQSRLVAICVLALCAVVAIEGWSVYSPQLLALGMGIPVGSIYVCAELGTTRLELADGERADAEWQEEAEQFQRRLSEEVIDRTRAVEATAREMERLCHSVSHDLRPPLRTIDGFSQILEEGATHRGEAETAEGLRKIRALAQSMGARIDKLLATVRKAHAALARRSVDLSRVALEEKARLAPVDPAVAWSIEEGVMAEGDPVLASALLAALIRDAFAASRTSTRPEVTFGSRAGERGVVYFVRDSRRPLGVRDREEAARALAGDRSTRELSPTASDVAALAHALVQREAGRVWLDASRRMGVEICFELRGEPGVDQIAGDTA